jgi:hypothetical protein
VEKFFQFKHKLYSRKYRRMSATMIEKMTAMGSGEQAGMRIHVSSGMM